MSEAKAAASELDPVEDEGRTTRLADLGLQAVSLVHELRQPLFALKAAVQLGAKPDGSLDAERVQEVLARVAELEELLEHHGDRARAEPPSFPFDLNEPVRRAVEVLEAHARDVGARVDLRLADERLWVRGRPGAARQVMINLLKNAYDAVRGRREAAVVVVSRAVGRRVLVVVEDTGPGIPETLRPRLFEPFVTTKPPGEGTGLGLFIARKLVGEAGGALRLTCPPEGGTRVEVELPAHP